MIGLRVLTLRGYIATSWFGGFLDVDNIFFNIIDVYGELFFLTQTEDIFKNTHVCVDEALVYFSQKFPFFLSVFFFCSLLLARLKIHELPTQTGSAFYCIA